jgi:hypothetical protein
MNMTPDGKLEGAKEVQFSTVLAIEATVDTILSLQMRILAKLEERDLDEVREEVNAKWQEAYGERLSELGLDKLTERYANKDARTRPASAT